MNALTSVYNYVLGLYDMNNFTLLHDVRHSLPFISVGFYLAFIFLYPRIIRKSISLKFLLILWNIFFSVFSLIVHLGITIPFLEILLEDGVAKTMCDSNNRLYQPSWMIFWSSLMILSKFAELFDTVFIVVKHPEKEIEFLHWYHHTSVVIFSWYGWVYRYQPGFMFMIMNSAIHAVMYFYYGLRELGYTPRWGFLLTQAQTLQMLIGVLITLGSCYLNVTQAVPCPMDEGRTLMMWMSLVIYGSYLYLFAQFYFKRYKPKAKDEKSTQ